MNAAIGKQGTRGLEPRARVLTALTALLVFAAIALGIPLAPAAAEFITPKGLNVEAQSAMLKQRVTQMASELVGDKLVDVVVHIGYLRTNEKMAASRVKLPGFNHYIRPGEGSEDIIPAHTRLRQVVVMVEDSLKSKPEAIEEELRQMGNFDSEAGDLVRVIAISRAQREERENGKAMMAAAKEEDEKKAKEEEEARKAEEDKARDEVSKAMTEEEARIRREANKARLGQMMAEASLAEAQSTLVLIKARQAFFRGDLDRAMDQILQSIAQNPNNPQAYAMLGSLYYAVDWKNLAVKYWEKSLTLDPNNTELEDLMNRVRFKTNF